MLQKPFTILLLVSLLKGETHTFGLLQQMNADAPGGISVSSRSVYREIPRLIAKNLVEATPNTRPVRYRLTKQGRAILHWEYQFAATIQTLLKSRL